ncbi:hypothetical protein GCM10010308_37030 [Streptomyces vinaceusdrappus]|nr:hypothetical protein GCM10010308_37030 [Streptomyces vinaceusdrappus]
MAVRSEATTAKAAISAPKAARRGRSRGRNGCMGGLSGGCGGGDGGREGPVRERSRLPTDGSAPTYRLQGTVEAVHVPDKTVRTDVVEEFSKRQVGGVALR